MEELMQVFAIENLELLEQGPILNNQHNPQDPFLLLNERQFIRMFRLSKNVCRWLIDLLEPYMRPQIRRRDLDVKTRILTALRFYARFYAGGSYQFDVASNMFLDISQSTVSRSLQEVTNVLNHPDIFNEWVKFPSSFEELNALRLQFYQQHNIPGVIGCIDCTHVAIVSPKTEDPEYPEHLYVNRKHYHSINVQLVCDANRKILNVCAKYPGSTHDSYIWNRSNLLTFMRNLHHRGHTDYYLLGDSGYPLRSWLLTPFDNPIPNTPEYNFNSVHKSTRVKIECCNGLLKSRFRCLLRHRVLHYHPTVACKIINACVVLHNICIENNIPEPDDNEEDVEIDFGIYNNEPNAGEEIDHDVLRRVNPELADGRRARMRITRNILHR